MKMYENQLSILFLCIKSKKDKKNTCPVYCRLTKNKESLQFFTTIRIHYENWNQNEQLVNKKQQNYHELNAKIQGIREKIEEFNTIDNELNVSKLRDKFLTQTTLATVKKCIDFYHEHKKKEVGTILNVKSYNRIFKISQHFSNYCCINKIIYFTEIDFDIMKDYENYLLNIKNFSNDYSIKCLQLVKSIAVLSAENQLIKLNKIQSFKLRKRKKSEIVFLTEKEVNLLKNSHLNIDRLDKVKDLFLFQCYTGLAYVDIYRFNTDCIEEINENTKIIRIKRQKTDILTMLPFLPQAEKIWLKYAGNLPKISNQRYNTYLKEISVILNIKKHLTTHTARKTFAMFLLDIGISIEVVSRSLGHGDIKTTQKVYATIQQNRIIKEYSKFSLI